MRRKVTGNGLQMTGVGYDYAMNRTERMIIAAALAAITMMPIAYFILAR
jgi:hypothetical protein